MKRGGHMLHFERSLTSYITILDHKFVSGRPKNNNYDSKSCPLNSVGKFSIIIEHVHDVSISFTGNEKQAKLGTRNRSKTLRANIARKTWNDVAFFVFD